MDERLRESISALMDDEANELELQRVLSNVDDELASVWHRYHQVRQVVRDCDRDVMSIDIRESLTLALDDAHAVPPIASEVVPDDIALWSKPKGQETRSRVAASLAIAASAVLALLVTMQYQGAGFSNGDATLIAHNQDSHELLGGDTAQTLAVKTPKIHVEFDERHARRFNEYLLRHAEHSAFGSGQGLMPLARVASVNSVGI